MADSASERALLTALGHGERAAAEALVERTWANVFALSLRLTGGDRELASDITQDTYRRAWQHLAAFDARARLATWLYRIATNTFLNHIRRPRLVVPLDDDLGRQHPDGAASQEDQLASVEEAERVRRAVIALPEEQRFVVIARFWCETPVREIARAEGISQVAVRKRLKRALSRLALAIEENA
jgi:RNA polymerase sigma-70 factor (ECF subfamily)